MRKLIIGAAVLAIMALGTSTFAQSTWGTDTTAVYKRDMFTLSLGAFVTGLDTSAKLDSSYGQGTTIDFEKVFGLSSNQTVFRADASWRFTPRQQLVFSYMQINRTGSNALNASYVWGDTVYLAGLRAEAKWDTTQANVAYRFSFVQTDKGEFGGSIGVSYLQQKAALKGWAQVTGGANLQYYAQTEATLEAPVPVVGLFGTYEFTPALSLTGDIQYLDVTINDIKGKYTDARLTLDYYPWRNVGFGVGYLYDKVVVDSTKSSWVGSVDYKFDGFLGYVSFRF